MPPTSPSQPSEYRAPWWGLAWRIVAALAFSAVAWSQVVADQSGFHRGVDVLVGSLAFAVVLARRRMPLTVAVVTVVLAAFCPLAAGPSTLAIASLATGRRWSLVLGVGLLSVVGNEIYVELFPSIQVDPRWLSVVSNGVFVFGVLGWGMYVGSRRELLWNLRRRAEVAEAERDLRATQSRLEERSRIAREMHDVLAHRISQISVRAGALEYRPGLGDEEVRASAGVIRESAHAALTDLRGVLGVLRDGAGERQLAPQPTYDDIAELVDQARRSGMRVAFTDTVSDASVPDVVGRTLYRVVQEGLTNASKHATGAEVEILLGGTPRDGVCLTARNALRLGRSVVPGAGVGLVGLTERVQLCGGRLARDLVDGDFVLRVWVPWTP